MRMRRQQKEAISTGGSDFKRRFWWLALLAVVCLMAGYALQRDRPERLLENPPGLVSGSGLVVRRGELYWTSNDGDGFIVHAVPVTGGKSREVVRENRKEMDVNRVTITDTEVSYVLSPKRPSSNSIGGGRSGPFLGTFLRSPEALQPKMKETRTILPAWRPPRQPGGSLLRHAPLSGGSAQTLAVPTEGYPLDALSTAVVGQTLYWVRPRSGPTVRVRSREGIREEREAHDDLMIAPLDGRPPRKAATGLFSSGLLAGANGVAWKSPRIYPDRRQDLYYLRVGETLPRVIRDYNGFDAPVEYRERFYWIEQIRDPQTGRLESGDLLSARWDGSDRRVALALRNVNKTLWGKALTLHRGRLYLLYAVHKPPPIHEKPEEGYFGPAEHPAEHFLARLQPEDRTPLAATRRLPPRFHGQGICFDGDYFYFLATEDRVGWLDWMSETSTAKSVNVLYRVRLPE